MEIAENFSQERMNRCKEIQSAIMRNWQKTNRFDYIVRATAPVHGLELPQLQAHYFAVGVGEQLTDVPFLDLLVIFSMIEQECAALANREDKTAKRFTIRYQIKTSYTDEEAARLLSQMRIETPFDSKPLLKIVAVRNQISPDQDSGEYS